MSVLVVLIPPRPRDAALRTARPAAAEPAREWVYVFSRDGQAVQSQGRASPDRMPAAARVVAALHEEDVSWVQATLPKAAPSRLRDVLAGAVEDELLEDLDAVHLALQTRSAPLSAGGAQPAPGSWVAVISKAWLQQELQALTDAGVHVDGLVALAEPGPELHLHAREGPRAAGELVCAGPMGVAIAPMDWAGLEQRLLEWKADRARWTAEPAAAARLARHGQQKAALLSRDQRLIEAAQRSSNLLQFDLTPRRKGVRALRSAMREFTSPQWRAARIGLLSLALVQIIGLNAWAWHQSRQTQALEEAMATLLRATFPQTRTVVDAPLQMAREVQALMRSAGAPGPDDLESLLDRVATAWPAQATQAQALSLDARGLHITAEGISPELQQGLQGAASALGWSLQREGNTLSLLRPAGARP